MRIRSQVFLGILLVVSLGFVLLLQWILNDLSPKYRASVEEPLVDTARVLAALAATTAHDGHINVAAFRRAFAEVETQAFSAPIYEFIKTGVDLRVYITDHTGTVVFASQTADQIEGQDYSQWRDVYLTLQGTYGARTTRDVPDDPASSVMYIAAPIVAQGETIGVLAVGKPTHNTNQLVARAKRHIIAAGTITGVAIILVGLAISGMLLHPIQRLTQYAQAVRDGKRATLPTLGGSEISTLGQAFEEMRDALEGKQYIERYVQTLTHEIKSPLAAIQGAAELLQEAMPPARREQFLQNIVGETQRIQTVVEKLLLLASLENRKAIQDVGTVDLVEIVQDAKERLAPLLTTKHITLDVNDDNNAPRFRGERFLVQQAVINLLHNAVEFTPPSGGGIRVRVRQVEAAVELVVQDHGPGIPTFACDRVFERFYSLPRPDTGKKSSGLGLSLVYEVAALHGGSIHLTNAPEGGAVARLTFPLAPL